MKETIDAILAGFEERQGYPPGENYLDDAVEPAAITRLARQRDVPSELTELYSYLRELSATDVGVGYRIHSPSHVEQFRSELQQVTGRLEDSVVVFGTDGGGNYLAISSTGSGLVYYLPHEARLDSGIYQCNNAEFRIVAQSLDAFRAALLAGFKSFLQSGTARIF